jgi:hypothetical protein
MGGNICFNQERAEQLRYPPRGVRHETRAAEHAKARHQHAHQHHVQIRPQPRDRVQGTIIYIRIPWSRSGFDSNTVWSVDPDEEVENGVAPNEEMFYFKNLVCSLESGGSPGSWCLEVIQRSLTKKCAGKVLYLSKHFCNNIQYLLLYPVSL